MKRKWLFFVVALPGALLGLLASPAWKLLPSFGATLGAGCALILARLAWWLAGERRLTIRLTACFALVGLVGGGLDGPNELTPACSSAALGGLVGGVFGLVIGCYVDPPIRRVRRAWSRLLSHQ